MSVRFCPSCRGLILPDFRFCPHCGAQAPRGPGIEEALGGPFSRMGAEGGGADTGAKALAEAAESLARLEADMDLLIEAIEKEGRSSPK